MNDHFDINLMKESHNKPLPVDHPINLKALLRDWLIALKWMAFDDDLVERTKLALKNEDEGENK